VKNLKKVIFLTAIVAIPCVVTAAPAWAQPAHVEKTHAATVAAATKPVTWDTFVRAESDKYFKSYVDLGGFGKFYHIRTPTPIHKSMSKSKYADSIVELDAHIGMLMDNLRALGLDKNTLVFCTTDNGAWQDVYPRGRLYALPRNQGHRA
jgi:membrane-anchored protein YejM (alkaline phosphatase superfamily)